MTNTDIQPGNNGRRQRQLIIAAIVFIVLGAIWLGYWLLIARFIESTDDAYVNGNIIQVTPRVTGTVVTINADDTDWVTAGQPLVILDDSDARVALEQAEANLAYSVRQVRSLFNGNESLRARIAQQQSVVTKALSDVKRRQGLDSSGAVSREEMHHTETAVETAKADLLAAQEELAANLALTDSTTVINHPHVKIAASKVKEAYLELQRTSVPAAVDGYVSKRRVQLGQRVAPGLAMMAIVPLNELWVDANFKESQLAHIRIGQPVTLTTDIYGNSVTYHGKVAGLDAGTGSAFSLLPPQNATGNWIKVVQRVPVRISLDPDELAQNPLRLGLSITTNVDITDDSGKQLQQVSAPEAAYFTHVYEDPQHVAEERIASIIAANLGQGSAPGQAANDNAPVTSIH